MPVFGIAIKKPPVPPPNIVDSSIFDGPTFGSGGSFRMGCISPAWDLYCFNTVTKKIQKFNGISNELVATINFPIGYEAWSMTSLTWNHATGRLVWGGWTSSNVRAIVELTGFTTTPALEISLEHNSSGVTMSSARSIHVDHNLDRIISYCTAYDGQYHNYIHHWNYPAGTKIGWYGRCSVHNNGAIHTFHVENNTRMYVLQADVDNPERYVREFDYYNYPGTGYTPTKSTTTGFSLRELRGYGGDLDPAGDMWMMGTQTSNPYYNLIRGYQGISDTRR